VPAVIASAPPSPDLPDAAAVRRAVAAGLRRYYAERRARVEPFVDRYFSLRGTARLHRAALGWDIARAPANLVLAGPQIGLKAAAAAARALGAARLGAALGARDLLLETAVAREVEWLIRTELLELPWVQGTRVATRDALGAAILEDPHLAGPLARLLAGLGERAGEPDVAERLARALETYGASRAAAAEIATGLLTLSTGALALNKLTPGAVTLGPALAGAVAQQSAISAFPLGAGLGSLWYGAFPAVPSAALVAGLTGGVLLGAATAAAFAGLVTDPVQRRLGLHQRRLQRLINALERQTADPSAPAFAVHDGYVARVLDLFDWLACAHRLVHG
jgi:hypothetical protein